MEKTQNKTFIFLYPQQRIFDHEINRGDSFKSCYSKKLNSCIHYRYRKKGFSIVYAIFNDSQVAEIIQLQSRDRIIHVGMDSITYRTKGSNGEYSYSDQDFILNQIVPVEFLRVGGFHMWSCVEKLARRAHARGINVLVDEDLTEFFAGRLNNKDFRIKSYPTYDARKLQKDMFGLFMSARKNKPWLFQNY